jgi:TonB family protein
MLRFAFLILLAAPAAAQAPADSVYDHADVPPALLPDDATALTYLRLALGYPNSAADTLAGTVYLQVVVDTSGAVSDAAVARGLNADADRSALGTVRLLRFRPAQVKGRAVRSRTVIPVRFDPDTPTGAQFDSDAFPLPDQSAEMLPNPGAGARALAVRVGEMTAQAGVQAEGQVVIGFEVDPNGLVHDPHVLRSLQPAADSIALEAVRSSTGFSPARLGGEPVRSYQTLPVAFRLAPPASEPAVYDSVSTPPQLLPDMRTRLRLLQERIPSVSDLGLNRRLHGRVVVQFVVDEQGRPRQFSVVRGLHPLVDDAVVNAMRTMWFTPALLDGKPVQVRMTMPITFRTR